MSFQEWIRRLGGGVILFAANDSKLYALDKHTGEVIFTKDLTNGAAAVLGVYGAGAREYVL
jgi:quinoprotein glucose dehydrogenase